MDHGWEPIQIGNIVVQRLDNEHFALSADESLPTDFIDRAPIGSVLLPGRPFAWVEGPEGGSQLSSPVTGEIVEEFDVGLAEANERVLAFVHNPDADAEWGRLLSSDRCESSRGL